MSVSMVSGESYTVNTQTHLQVESAENPFFQLTADLLCVLDFDGYFQRLNPIWEKTLSFTCAELMARPMREFVHPEDRSQLEAEIEKLRSSENSISFENRFGCKDGSYKWLLWNATVCDRERMVYAAARDITQTKHAEVETLAAKKFLRRDRAERLSRIFDQTFDFIALLQPDGTVLEINQTLLDFGGFQLADVEGRPFWQTLLWTQKGKKGLTETQVQLQGAIASAAAGEFVRYTVDWLGAGDAVAQVDFSLKPFREETGEVVLLIAEGRNISDRIIAQNLQLRSENSPISSPHQIEEEKQKFIALVENSSELIAMATLAGKITYMNEAGRQLTGLDSKEAAIGTDILNYYPEETWALVRAIALRAVHSTGRWEGEAQLRHLQTSKRIDVHMTLFLLRKAQNGEPICMAIIIRNIAQEKQVEAALRQAKEDLEIRVEARAAALRNAIHKLQVEITERKQVEEALQKEREFLNALLNSVEAGIVACDERGVITLFNRAVQEFYGLPEQSVNAREWEKYYDLYLPDGKTPMPKEEIPLWRSLRGEKVRDVEMVIAPKRGTVRTFHASGQAIFDAQGNKLGAVVAMHDITKSKRTEEAQRQSATELSRQAKQLQEALRELQRTQTQLVQIEKMSSLGQLVAGVAHEINNPVNFIYGNLAHAGDYLHELLNLLHLYQKHYPIPVAEIEEATAEIDLDFLESDLPKLLVSMKVGAERIRSIVLSLRNFSRLDEAEMKSVDIHEGLDNTLLILHNQLKPKKGSVGIEVVKEYGNLPLVECYPGQLNQAFMNVLTNAIDALSKSKVRSPESGVGNTTRPSPCIRIRTEAIDGDWVAIAISDNGPGIPLAVRDRLFDPFFTTKPVGQGTGLGLSITYQIVVHKHGGFLKCVSDPGQGAEFWIQIPIRQSAANR